jgi:hypothetical protein
MVWFWRHALYPSLISFWTDTAINNHTHDRYNFQQRTSTFTLLYKIQYSSSKTAASKLVTMTLYSTFQSWSVKKKIIGCFTWYASKNNTYIQVCDWEFSYEQTVKGKAHPTTGHERGEGSGGIAPLFPLAVILRVVKATPRPFYTLERDLVPIAQESGWAPGPVWTGAEYLSPSGIRSPDHSVRSESLYRLRYTTPLRFTVLLGMWGWEIEAQ